MNSINIIWEEPGEDARGRKAEIYTPELIGALKSRPGKWALIQKNVVASSIGKTRKRHPYLEIVSRSSGRGYARGRADIYARWVGEAK